MSTEREMLEAAARAMGMRVLAEGEKWPDENVGWFYNDAGGRPTLWNRADLMFGWNPRHSKEQSMDLMAALRISVEHNRPTDSYGWVIASVDDGEVRSCYQENVPDESQRADRMRLAILRCAAAQAPKEE